MAILKIRDADGNIQEILAIRGEPGKDYILTDADKQEIAGSITPEQIGAATKEELLTAVGNIETAIDIIIAIQNELIGGDSV